MLIALCALAITGTQAQDDQKPCACCGEEYRQFDFWVGDWEAFGPKGNLAGTNNIVVLQDQCIIQENWASANGAYTGTSYNHYDSQTGKWNQLWLDNQGGSLQLTGGLTDGKMILTGAPSPGGDGKNYISRITWTPNQDGSVRQHWEAQVEGEVEWQTWFNGLYKKKK